MASGGLYFWLGASAEPTGLGSADAPEPVKPSPSFGCHPSRWEFRPDSKGNFDELIARFDDGSVFFEDLGENGLFVDLRWNDGRGVRLWAGPKRGCLTYNHEADQ